MNRTEQHIDEAARRAAREVVSLQRRQRVINLYRATERLLRAYPALKRLHDHPEAYGFVPVGRSKDISVAPPPGSVARDPIEALAEHVDARAASYDRTAARFAEIDAVVRLFEGRDAFIIIRMYYFGEDVWGNERAEDAPRWTFEEIQEELASIGIERNVKTLRSWRTNLVQEMCVLLFGVDGAVSVEDRAPAGAEIRHEEG